MWAMGSTLLGDEIGEPRLDITPAEAKVFTNPEATRSRVAVPPGVDGLHRNLEVVGELLNRQ
jgi:hypothetical protein